MAARTGDPELLLDKFGYLYRRARDSLVSVIQRNTRAQRDVFGQNQSHLRSLSAGARRQDKFSQLRNTMDPRFQAQASSEAPTFNILPQDNTALIQALRPDLIPPGQQDMPDDEVMQDQPTDDQMEDDELDRQLRELEQESQRLQEKIGRFNRGNTTAAAVRQKTEELQILREAFRRGTHPDVVRAERASSRRRDEDGDQEGMGDPPGRGNPMAADFERTAREQQAQQQRAEQGDPEEEMTGPEERDGAVRDEDDRPQQEGGLPLPVDREQRATDVRGPERPAADPNRPADPPGGPPTSLTRPSTPEVDDFIETAAGALERQGHRMRPPTQLPVPGVLPDPESTRDGRGVDGETAMFMGHHPDLTGQDPAGAQVSHLDTGVDRRNQRPAHMEQEAFQERDRPVDPVMHVPQPPAGAQAQAPAVPDFRGAAEQQQQQRSAPTSRSAVDVRRAQIAAQRARIRTRIQQDTQRDLQAGRQRATRRPGEDADEDRDLARDQARLQEINQRNMPRRAADRSTERTGRAFDLARMREAAERSRGIRGLKRREPPSTLREPDRKRQVMLELRHA